MHRLRRTKLRKTAKAFSMPRLFGPILALICVSQVPLAAAPLPQPLADQGLLYLQRLDQRIADISWRIVSANVALCPDRATAIGISLHNAAQYAPKHRAAAIDTFHFGDGLPAILAVAKMGPADRAGLRPDDRITAINDQQLEAARVNPAAKEDYAVVSDVMDRLEDLPANQSLRLMVRRGDDIRSITIQPQAVCRSRVEVVPGSPINANSNGKVVQLYGKLVLWTKSDDELAIIIAHEMAHNILEHNQRIDQERIGVGVFTALGFAGSRLRDMEREADRYGLFLAARAGYDYHIGPSLWRRLSATTGLGGLWGTTHPSGANRFKSNQTTVIEIDRQKVAGGDIAP